MTDQLGYHAYMKLKRLFAVFVFAITFVIVASNDPALAQDREVPYWATLRFDQVNMRKGPSQDFPIDWV
ncbi:MAG: hypothetical protein AAGI28_12025, partial [Pseudomonadota bacterium]